MNKKSVLKQKDSGFTLIEMALVMVIGGVLLSFMGSALLMYVKKSRVQKTEVRIEAIKEALSQHLSVNRRYPCPARRDIAPGDAPGANRGFGVEVSSNCSSGGNSVGGTANSTVLIGTAPNTIRIGSVPTRTLNLPDDMAVDGWGHRFTYAVTTDLATVNGTGTQYTNDGGQIRIADSTNTVFVTDAHYTIVSHGVTGEGSLPLNANFAGAFASIGLPCSGTALDRENCDNDNRFLITLVNSEDSANFYDDYLYYQGQTAPALLIPEGAVMAFNLSTCPDGWTNFTGAEGKVVIGSNDGVAPPPTTLFPHYKVNVPVDADSNTATADVNQDFPIETYSAPTVAQETDHNFNLNGTQALPSSALIPPYVALLYCEKLPE